MSAYELSEKKNKVLRQIDYLQQETNNNTETVLLTNDEVFNVIEILTGCLETINEQLKKIVV